MPWTPLPRLAFAICTYPFTPASGQDLPLQIGDELYIIEQGGQNGEWYRGYLVAPPSLLAGLTSTRGQTLEKRVFTGIFPAVCVEIRELLGDVTSYGKQDGSPSITQIPTGLDSPRDRRSAGPRPPDVATVPQATEPDDTTNEEQAAAGQAEAAQTEDQSLPNGGVRISALSPTAIETQFPRKDSVIAADTASGKPAAPVPMLKIGDESAMAKEEPLVDEIASCLREWHSSQLHGLLLNRQYSTLDNMSALVTRLDYTRRQLLHTILTQRELTKVREQVVWDLVNGNKMLSGDVIVRSAEQKGRILTCDDPAVEVNRQQAMMSLLDDPPKPQQETRSLYHLYSDVKTFSFNSEKPTTVSLTLYVKRQDKSAEVLTETFSADATSRSLGVPAEFQGAQKTLFTDVSASDLGEGASPCSVYLVAKVVMNEAPLKWTPSMQQQPASRDGHSSQGSTGFNAANWRPGNFNLAARRSLMFNPNRRKDGDNSAQQSTSRPDSSAPQGTQNLEPRQETISEDPRKDKPVKRLVSLGVVDVSNHIRNCHDAEMKVQLLPLSWTSEETDGRDETWNQLFSQIVGDGHLNRSSKAATGVLTLQLKSFKFDSSEGLIQATPTLLHDIIPTPRLGFAGAPTTPRSDIYITLNKPLVTSMAFLSHPRAGTVPLAPDQGLGNLQLTLEVRNSAGQRIENCIYPSSNSAGHTAWRTRAVESGESWNQTIRLAITPSMVPGSHLVMSLANAFEFPFALAWMPLWIQEAFIRDNEHALALYKYDEHTSSMISGKGAYLSLPWNIKAKDESVIGSVATLQLSTYLSSTAYSQDPILLGVLHWRDHRTEQQIRLLRKFPFIPEIEIVKLLPDVFDALFGTIIEFAGTVDFEDLVLHALITVLTIVHDRRFNIQPLVDSYAAEKFNYPFAFPCLRRSFVRLLDDPANSEHSRRLRSGCKVGGYVIHFMIKSRQQQIEKEVNIGIKSHNPTFAEDFKPLIASAEKLMQDDTPALVGTKTLMVQYLHEWIIELANAMSPSEVFETAIRLVDATEDAQGKLILYRILLIRNLSASDLFIKNGLQGKWQTAVAKWLSPYWGYAETYSAQWREQIRLCCSVVSTIYEAEPPSSNIWLSKLIQSYNVIQKLSKTTNGTYSLIFPTSYPFPTRPTNVTAPFDEALIEISALLAATARIAPSAIPEMPLEEQARGVIEILHVSTSILNFEAFPSSFLSVHLYNHRTCFAALEAMYSILTARFLPPPDDAVHFNDAIWKTFMRTLFRLCASDALALETFPEQKRRAVWKIVGDVRELGADLLYQAWNSLGWDASAEQRGMYGLERLGGYQVSYVPGLIGPIMHLCLSVHEGLRSVAVGVVHSMIVSEWELNESLVTIQTEMIDQLDQLYKDKPMNNGMQEKQFIEEVRARFEHQATIRGSVLYAAVIKLLDTVGELLDLLVAVYVPDAAGDAFQIMETLRLLEYLKDMDKVDIYVGYVHKLTKLQVDTGNYTEAALALQLHADLYEWDTTRLLPAVEDPSFPQQLEFDRKERLYLEMISHFENASDWTQALARYKELASQYEENKFDFTKLARCQRAMAVIYEKIGSSERQPSRFFRVLYRGLGFPTTLRDKQFIFEGAPADRLVSFTDKMQEQYPSASIIGGGPLDEIEGQYLSIYPVSAQKDFLHPVNRRIRTTQAVKEHLVAVAPRQFANTTRRQASNAGVQEQIQEKVVYTTAEPFPTILRRSEVVKTETVRMSPVEIGLERATRKTNELNGLANAAKEGGESAFTGLTEALMILVNQKSIGTVAGYWDLLPPENETTVDEETGIARTIRTPLQPLEEALKVSLIDHVLAIRRAFEMYSRSAHQATKAELTKDLELTFAPVVAYIDANLQQSVAVILPEESQINAIRRRTLLGQPAQAGAGDASRMSQANNAGQLENRLSGQHGVAGNTLSSSQTNRQSTAQDEKRFESSRKTLGRFKLGEQRSFDNLAKQASLQNIQARVGSVTGSVTKRLSALNVGLGSRRGPHGPPKSPVIPED